MIMQIKTRHNVPALVLATGIMIFVMMPLVFADIYINVMAVNGAPERKETVVKQNLPGDLKAQDIVDTNGLQLDYNVNDANYYVHTTLTLDPKESKTFRVQVKDIWKITPPQIEAIKASINKGYEQIGKPHDAQKAELLQGQLIRKLDFIAAQSTKADSVERRIDAYRTYRKELERLEERALAVDYWRSEPGELKEKIIRFKIEVENPVASPTKMVKQKHYLPSEIKPRDLIETEGFEVRFDEQKQQPFLFKEEEIPQGEKRSYSIGIRDIWLVPQKDIDYLKGRAGYAYEFLKGSKYDESAKTLFDHANLLLADIVSSQALTLEIKEHISAYRFNLDTFQNARQDVENLEKLLSIYREDLEKSKVENVLQKIRSLNGVAGVAKQMFEKKPTPSNTWNYIGWIVMFIAALTVVYFVVLMLRRGKASPKEGTAAPEQKQQPQEKK